MCPDFVVNFVENIRSWNIRFGLHFEVVGEDESITGRAVCGLGINVDFCMCGRWIAKGCWEKQ